ncbi:hypothetical protein M0804_013375 [Polistes exclamans]|nr:hypothetical protein M0804_013375 [Polistes exclamans]
MAQNQNPQISLDQFELRLAIWRDAIPIYEGGTRFLLHFLQTCDKFVENLMTNDDAINTSLFALIKTKLRGEALDLIVDAQLIALKFTFYETVAKNVFINGIKEPYHTHLTYFELENIEACLMKCRKLDNHKQQAAFLNFTRQRESKRKPYVFGTGNNSRNSNLFNAPRTSGNGNLFQSFQPPLVTAQAPPRFATNFGNNFGKSANNQPRQQNYQLTTMSVDTGSTSRPNRNQAGRSNKVTAPSSNIVLRLSKDDIVRTTRPPNFISEEQYNQKEQEETSECQEE